MPSPTDSCLAAFILYCVMRSSQPSGVTQVSIQASSAWAGTADCTMMEQIRGSIPAARYSAAASEILARSSAGSW